MKNKWTHISSFIAELCPSFDLRIVNLWNILNKMSGDPLELGS